MHQHISGKLPRHPLSSSSTAAHAANMSENQPWKENKSDIQLTFQRRKAAIHDELQVT
jgi:hypothetical protein